MQFLTALLNSPGFSLLRPTERHQTVLAQTLADIPDLHGNVMHDLHTAVLMLENSVEQICTFDRDFHRFQFLKVVDPLN